jgi:hypothetical protein
MPQNLGNAAGHVLSGQKGTLKTSASGTASGAHTHIIKIPPGITRTIVVTMPAQIGLTGLPIAYAVVKVPPGGSIATT